MVSLYPFLKVSWSGYLVNQDDEQLTLSLYFYPFHISLVRGDKRIARKSRNFHGPLPRPFRSSFRKVRHTDSDILGTLILYKCSFIFYISVLVSVLLLICFDKGTTFFLNSKHFYKNFEQSSTIPITIMVNATNLLQEKSSSFSK